MYPSNRAAGAPVVTVPPSYAVAARPRNFFQYDSQGMFGGSPVNVFPFFQDSTGFVDVGLGHKRFGLDTNMVGPGGALSRGYYFRVFCMSVYMTRRGTQALTAAAISDKQRMWDMGYVTFLMGSTPYLYAPLQKMPSRTGLTGPLSTTEPLLTAGDVQMGWPICTACYDLTVPGKIRKQTPEGVKEIRVPRIPIEFAETESYQVNITYPVLPNTPPIVGTVFMQVMLGGIMLQPLSG